MKMRVFAASILACAFAVPGPASASAFDEFVSGVFGSAQPAPQMERSGRRHGHRGAHAAAHHQSGVAHHASGGSFTAMTSYYGGGPRKYEPNSHTASGEVFRQWGLTAAHRSLPMGTRLLLSHGGRSVVVRVNDRGPAPWTGRSLDVSRGAAARLGLLHAGTGAVHVTVLASR